MPPVETDADLTTFFSADEFGTAGVVSTKSGQINVVGIMDIAADHDRPGANSRSGSSPFVVGSADATIHRIQFVTRFSVVSSVRAEDTLNIPAGVYAGNYRIRDIQRDGEVCRLLLNKA